MRSTKASATATAALCAAVLALPTAVLAQSSDAWQYGLQIYGYFPTVSGTSSFPQTGSSPNVNIKMDDFLDLDFAFMGTFEARKGRWGGFTDLMYLDIGSSKSGTRDIVIGGGQIPATGSANVNYDLQGIMWTIAGEYRTLSDPNMFVDVFAGARYIDLQQDVSWEVSGDLGSIPLPGRAGNSTVSRTNWDGIVGVKGRLMFRADRRWFVPYYFDVGAGDSDLTWQAMSGVGYSWQWGDVVAGWRHLDYDLGEGKPFTDVDFNGPMISVTFRW